MLKAYAAGVNAIATSGRPLPLEYRLLGVTPEPWEPMHSLAAFKLLALGSEHELGRRAATPGAAPGHRPRARGPSRHRLSGREPDHPREHAPLRRRE